jgi:molybdenum cofactor cytidylyltransferase
VTSGIILAAGSSTRLGQPKQLLDLGGKPVLQRVVDAALSCPLDEIVLVLGHAAREIAEAVPPRGRVRVAHNPDHDLGQSTSLKVGLHATDAGSQAAVLLLGDQPGIRVDAIAAVVTVWRDIEAMAVQAAYEGRPAHPVLFDRRAWPDLEEATGDEGARAILARHPEWRALAEVGGHPPEDIDTEADYQRVRAAFERGWAD